MEPRNLESSTVICACRSHACPSQEVNGCYRRRGGSWTVRAQLICIKPRARPPNTATCAADRHRPPH
eukprot:14792874-Alexandrium_andersonii.AAC.1